MAYTTYITTKKDRKGIDRDIEIEVDLDDYAQFLYETFQPSDGKLDKRTIRYLIGEDAIETEAIEAMDGFDDFIRSKYREEIEDAEVDWGF